MIMGLYWNDGYTKMNFYQQLSKSKIMKGKYLIKKQFFLRNIYTIHYKLINKCFRLGLYLRVNYFLATLKSLFIFIYLVNT